MNKHPDIQHAPRRFWSYCIAYLAWFTAIGVSGYLFLLFHTVFTKWYIALGLRHSAYRASSQLFMIVGGIVWLVFIFFTDDYLKSGIEKRALNHRLVLVFSALLLLALLAGASSLLTRPLLGVTS